MTKKELLTAYRNGVIELEELRRQLGRVGTDGRPSGVRSMQTDRIACGTNDPNAAAAQLADGLENMLHIKEAEQQTLAKEIDKLLGSIRDFRTYMVIHHYYILARTDEEVARTMSVSRGRVNQIRLEYLESA